MKTVQTLLTLVVTGLVITGNPIAQAAPYDLTDADTNLTYTSGTISLSQIIPDNSPVGVAFGFNFADMGFTVNSLVLNLNLSGGFNGDMYGYLQHGGTLIELFNPASFSAGGASGSTLNLSLASGTGLSSLSTATALNLAGGLTYAASGDLNGFVGANPFGLWTFFLADQSAGDRMTLNSFSLDITVVPEPKSWQIIIFFGIAFAGFHRMRLIRHRRQVTS